MSDEKCTITVDHPINPEFSGGRFDLLKVEADATGAQIILAACCELGGHCRGRSVMAMPQVSCDTVVLVL
jgi:hypothetical protein